MFNPNQIIFAPTVRCNLNCEHCRVSRDRPDIDTGAALAFLERAANAGIGSIGFSGGEPFLALDAVCKISARAVALDMLFDRMMTNGVWWSTAEELDADLQTLRASGFDGTIGLSWDSWHGQSVATIAEFIKSTHRVFASRDIVEILSVRKDGDSFQKDAEELADLLGGRLVKSETEILGITENRERSGDEVAGEFLNIPITRFDYSASRDEEAWQDEHWFTDDYCEGPGHVFYIHPDGKISACCGYANENEEIIIGSMDDEIPALIDNARKNPLLNICYVKGLAVHRKELEQNGIVFRGKTRDQCFFCDWLCHHHSSNSGQGENRWS